MITNLLSFQTCAASIAVVGALSLFVPPAAPPVIPFDEAAIYIEYNSTDGDAEVVVSIDADLGLERFRIVNPCGREILHLRSRHTDDIGVRKIALETPEPSLDEVLDAYPAGWYRFYGRAEGGQNLFSQVWLSHALPSAPTITFPLDGATGVPTSGAAATWTSGPDAESFFFELENDDLGADVKSNVPGGTTSFGLPSGWMQPSTEYQLGVGTRHENGNLNVVEIHFTTAP
jgi:hypothetical protein